MPLPDLCVAALKIRWQQQDDDRARAGDEWVDTGLVFTTRHGTPIEPRNLSRSFDRCITAARVPRITVHGTRKTCASLLAALDVHPRVAMRILRHSKIGITMEVYTEVPHRPPVMHSASSATGLPDQPVAALCCCCATRRSAISPAQRAEMRGDISGSNG
jgi:integrase